MKEIESRYRMAMQELAKDLDRAFNGDAVGDNRKNGFVLLVFPFGGPEEARANYISNADRKDMLVALKEIVARFEGQPGMKGLA